MERELVHYCIVRKDLPLGKIAAMLIHAAGESASLFEDTTKPIKFQEYLFGYQGFTGATAVALEAENEAHLKTIAKYLTSQGIQFIEIVEEDGFKAIGLVPGYRDVLGPIMQRFTALRGLTERTANETISKPNDTTKNEASSPTTDLPSEGVVAGYGHGI